MYHYPSDEVVDEVIRRLDLIHQYDPQSGTESNIFNVITPNEAGVGFQEGESNYMLDHGDFSDPTRNVHNDDKASYDDFFKRPVKIFQTEWGTGTALAGEVEPYYAYFTNPRVANRVSNFNLVKCKLRIKVMVNGNGFFFGRAIAAYHPLFNYDQLSTHAALVPQDLTQTTQLPKVFIDPTTSTGGEMTLPFFWHTDFLDITRTLDSSRDLGTLFLRSFSTLKHAQDANDGVTITVLAWCEDITLAVPTTVNAYQLSPQSGKEDEVDTANKQGIVSGPATNIAKIGKALSSVPVIGPYAMAASKAASGVAAGAKLLGYSRPALSSVDKYRPTPTGSLALGNVPDTVPKLALDEKQELTIDPRIAGLLPNDPLLIRNISMRESYLTKFNWQRGDASETCLFQSYVNPVLWSTSGTNTVHLPACAAAALPFSNWTGRMRFRFQVVSSAFHRGRLRVVYDPNQLPYQLDEYNVNYQQIFDVGDERDFTVEIGMGKSMTYLRAYTPGSDPVPFVVGPASQLDVLPEAGFKSNGVVGVYVVNELSVPTTTSANNNVEINVFVSTGDDFSVGIPDDTYQRYVFKPQSGLEADFDGQNTPEANKPEQDQASELNHTQTCDDLNKVFMGESIVSFRPLLKRYTIHRRLPINFNAGVVTLFERSCSFPYLRGAVPNPVNTTGTGAGYNYCNTVMLHWVRNMFAGWRGGIRYKIRVDPSPDRAQAFNVGLTGIIERNNPSASGIDQYFIDRTDNLAATAGNAAYQNTIIKGTSNRWDITRGGTMMISSVNPVMEAEIPYYSPSRFVPNKLSDYTGFPNFIEIPQMLVQLRGYVDAWNLADYYVAAGDDFQVYFFTGMPRLYFESSPPDPNPAPP